MIVHANPGYNLSRHREPSRAATGRKLAAARPQRRELSGLSLADLCRGLDLISVKGRLDLLVDDLCMDSRRASPGALFFALPGAMTDGSYYIEEAIDRGAVAVITEKARQHHPRATFIQVPDARQAMAEVCRRFNGFVPGQPQLIGICGSHGKTCVAHLLHHLLGLCGGRTGIFSSISYDLGSRVVPSYRTTPEAVDLYGMLAQVQENGCRRAILEISSHGLEQKRVHGLPLDVAVFVNLGREHATGQGGSGDSYITQKSLFDGQQGQLPGTAVINLDDPHGQRLIQALPEEVRLIRFGRASHADIRVSDVSPGEVGTSMRIHWPSGTAKIRTPLVEEFSVSNVLAAVAAAYAAGADLNLVLPRLASFGGVPGRMERVEEGQPFEVVVDSAYTPEAVRHALGALRQLTDGRLLVVFGCPGGGSAAVRARHVEAVQENADFAWATSANPRNEPVEKIFAEMKCGVADPQRLAFMEDRRRSIALALDMALPGDLVVLLGKGQENFEHVGDAALPFDDRLVARELLALREIALTTSDHA
jgi:UDP-N-acetylmuramoyl-L-alanyl-D-glutamate--2,6-diaminopimelate ligase